MSYSLPPIVSGSSSVIKEENKKSTFSKKKDVASFNNSISDVKSEKFS
jgi:hypothetical protein